MIYLIALLCVFGLAAGQILFKLAATSWHQAGTFLVTDVLFYFVIALALYGVTTIGWVWVLQKIELGKIYPLMALAFVIVPVASNLILGEKFQTQYFLGIATIIVGIMISVKA